MYNLSFELRLLVYYVYLRELLTALLWFKFVTESKVLWFYNTDVQLDREHDNSAAAGGGHAGLVPSDQWRAAVLHRSERQSDADRTSRPGRHRSALTGSAGTH